MTPVEKSHEHGLNGALAATLRAERAARRITIDQLVTSLGVSRSTVLRLLGGERAIDVAHLAAFAEAYKVDPAVLIQAAEARAATWRPIGGDCDDR